MKALVIVVEGVGATMLGPYGSAVSTTPAMNRLAAQSLLLDQCSLDSFDLALQLRSLWTATHAGSPTASDWSVWKAWHQAGIPALLITDSPLAAQVAEQYHCPRSVIVDIPTCNAPADSTSDCSLSHLFGVAMEMLATDDQLGVVWIHSQALRHPWDAPLELRASMTDPEDPPPPEALEVPHLDLDQDSDPDLIVGWGQVAAAQLAVLDEALDALEQTVTARADADQWTWMLCSTGGIPLGEHRVLGRPQRLGYIEESAVAAIIRPAHACPIGTRRAELSQLPDLPVTLLNAMGMSAPESTWGRSMLIPGPPAISTAWSSEQTLAWTFDGSSFALRCPAWTMIVKDETITELYAKPDDRWEVNNLATRGTEAIEALLALVPQIQTALASGQRSSLPKLDENLTSCQR